MYTLDDFMRVQERLDARSAEVTTQNLRNLMISLHITPEKAMDLLMIPEEERDTYRKSLENK